MLYRLLRAVARLALRWYYRSIEVVGAERLPAGIPLILAANHNNALVDALIVATSIDREVRLTAKATLLENPLTRVLVHSVGVVPLRRSSDEVDRQGTPARPGRNQGAFDAIVDTLRARGLVLIFPEGKSHSEPELAPLRTGCARIALQAASAGVVPLAIVPVGLTFEAKERPRSRVVMTVGNALFVDGASAHPSQAVVELTARLDAGLREVTLNFPSRDDAVLVLEISRTLSRVLHDVGPLHEAEPSLSSTVALTRTLEHVRRGRPALDAPTSARLDHFLARLQRFRQEARALGVAVSDVGMPTSRPAGTLFILRESLIGLALGPLALWGRANHWLPVHAALAIGRATSRNADEPAMHTLVGGLVLVLLTYFLASLLLAHSFGWPWAAGYLLLLPMAASLDFWWTDRVKRAIRRARGYLGLRANPEKAEWLVREKAELRQEVQELEALLR